MVPTLGLGIPGSDTMVLLLGALMLQGFVPGPRLMREAPELLHATAAGLIGTAFFLLLFGWPIGKLVLRVARLDRQVVLPMAFAITLIGVYAFRRSTFDVLVTIVFGVIGYFMIRYGFPVLAASVAMVLGPGFERELRAGLLLMRNDPIRFVSRPWTAGLLILGVILIGYGVRATRIERRRSLELAATAAQEAEPTPLL
jgi:putative tricarboxylic transport membrane protein